MTEPILPDDLANGLVDGTADISSLPAEFRGVAEVFASAHRPASDAELAGMAAAVQQFTAAVMTSTPAAANAGAMSTGVIAMFGTRITKRAAVIVGATVLFAGTAAAAAGGVLPSPFSSGSERHSTPTVRLESSSSEAASSSSESSIDESSSSSTESSVEAEGLDDSTVTSFPGRDFGHCVAWNNGTTKNTGNPAFGDLATQASIAEKSIDDYCVEVMAAHDADDDDDATSSSVDDNTSSSVDDKGGKGNGGHGADDPATSVSTPASVSNPANSAPGNSVDDSGQSGKGKGKGGNDSSTSSSAP